MLSEGRTTFDSCGDGPGVPPLIDVLGMLGSNTEVVSLLTVKLSRNTALAVHIWLSHTVVSMFIYSLYGTPKQRRYMPQPVQAFLSTVSLLTVEVSCPIPIVSLLIVKVSCCVPPICTRHAAVARKSRSH